MCQSETYSTQTAQALAQVVTLEVGSLKHHYAITILMQLIHHLSKPAPKFHVR